MDSVPVGIGLQRRRRPAVARATSDEICYECRRNMRGMAGGGVRQLDGAKGRSATIERETGGHRRISAVPFGIRGAKHGRDRRRSPDDPDIYIEVAQPTCCSARVRSITSTPRGGSQGDGRFVRTPIMLDYGLIYSVESRFRPGPAFAVAGEGPVPVAVAVTAAADRVARPRRRSLARSPRQARSRKHK